MTPPRVLLLSLPAYEVVRELAHDGASNAEIGDRLGLTIDAVKAHIKVAMAETGCANRTELAVRIARGRIHLDTTGRSRARSRA